MSKCSYCRGRLHDPEERKNTTCHECTVEVKKLDESTINRILRVIDGRVEEIINKEPI